MSVILWEILVSRKENDEKIKLALSNGLHRVAGVKATREQALTFIVSEKKYFHHANLESANVEKEFLQEALGKKLQLYKVWNVRRETLAADMKMLRTELSKQDNWDAINQAVDRVLCGAGY